MRKQELRQKVVSAMTMAMELERKYPEGWSVESVMAQLKYLLKFASGETDDRSRLKDIILGVQAVREIDALDEEFADLLMRINREVDNL